MPNFLCYVDVDGYKLKNTSKEFILKIVQTVQMLAQIPCIAAIYVTWNHCSSICMILCITLDDQTRNKLMFKTVPDLKDIQEKHTLKYPNLYKIMYQMRIQMAIKTVKTVKPPKYNSLGVAGQNRRSVNHWMVCSRWLNFLQSEAFNISSVNPMFCSWTNCGECASNSSVCSIDSRTPPPLWFLWIHWIHYCCSQSFLFLFFLCLFLFLPLLLRLLLLLFLLFYLVSSSSSVLFSSSASCCSGPVGLVVIVEWSVGLILICRMSAMDMFSWVGS